MTHVLHLVRRRSTVLLLGLILVLAAGVRFYNIHERGIFEYDEAWYLLEAKSLYDAGAYYQARFAGEDVGPLKEYLKRRGDAPITSFKPAHTVLILAGMLVFGPEDYASFTVSALLGTLTVLLVYGIGRLLFNARVGLLAATFLALSPFHVGYARSGMAQANSIFFVALGFYLWVQARHHAERVSRGRFHAGLAFGLAFTCHFNLFSIPVVFGLLDLLLPDTSGSNQATLRSRLRRSWPLAAGMCVPPLMFELPARILKAVGKLPEGQWTYFEQYAYRGQLASELTFSTDGALAFLEKLFVHEGLLAGLAVLGALVLLLRERRQADLVLWSVFLVPILPWSFLTVGLPPLWRTFAVSAVPMALLVGRSLDALAGTAARWTPRFAPAAAGLIGIVVATNGAYQRHPLLPATSGYREATEKWLDYVAAEGGVIDVFPGSSWPIWYFYLSGQYDRAPSNVRNHIRFYPGQSDPMPPPGDYDVVDTKRLRRAYGQNRPDLRAYLEDIERPDRVVAAVENPYAGLPYRFGEIGGTAGRRLHRDLARQPANRWILVSSTGVDHRGYPAGRDPATSPVAPSPEEDAAPRYTLSWE